MDNIYMLNKNEKGGVHTCLKAKMCHKHMGAYYFQGTTLNQTYI